MRTDRSNEPEVGEGGTLAEIVRGRRQAMGLTLQRLAEVVGCAKSYLSAIENDRRDRPPSDELLRRLELALGLEPDRLIRLGHWASTPASVKREVEAMQARQRAGEELARALREEGGGGQGLDALFRSGALRRLIDRAAPEAGVAVGGVELGMEVPLINSVQAGYPTEFTDLGYPARVADEYVRTPGVSDPDAFGARVVGASMEPDYREGDIVIFSPARDVRDGDDCFVRFERDGETTFKRVYFEEGGRGGGIRLQPLNSRFGPRVCDREEVGGMYAGVFVVRAISR